MAYVSVVKSNILLTDKNLLTDIYKLTDKRRKRQTKKDVGMEMWDETKTSY